MVHFEAGGDDNFYVYQEIIKNELGLEQENISNRDLNYQKALWPTVVQLVELANKYSTKLTLAFNPQWAEYILKDESKIAVISAWKPQGHEIAFHHHGINHIDWNGYTNRFGEIDYEDDYKYIDKYNSVDYIGTAQEGFDWIKKLNTKINSPDEIITGCITDTAIDKPQDIAILTTGNLDLDNDLISAPLEQILPNEEKIIWIRHFLLSSNFNPSYDSNLYSEEENFNKSKKSLEEIKQKYSEAENGDVAGVVFHGFDFYRFPSVYEDLFNFFQSQEADVKTVRAIEVEATQTCSELGGNICSTNETCSGDWLDASDSERCCDKNCNAETDENKYSPLGILPGIAPSGIDGKIILPKEQTGYIKDLNVPILNLKHNPIDWDNVEKKQGVYDFSKSDEEIQLFLSASNNLMLTLEPWNELYGTREGHSYGVEDYIGLESDFYPENNLDDWSNFVETTANRYCDSVKHYEFGHELAPWNPNHKGYWREHPEEYAEMFYLTHTTLKKGCPDAKLFSVGAQSNNLIAKDFEEGEFFAQVFDEFNKKGYGKFDNIGIDYHLWRDKEEDYKHYGEYITAIKKFMQKYGYDEDDFAIVSTSMGGGMNDEPAQANFLIKTYISATAKGQYLLFWQNIVENVAHTSFQYMGLMHNPYASDGLSHKKLAYYTYKLMVEKLEGSDWDNIETVRESDGVYVYKFTRSSGPVWVAWTDNESDAQVTISGVNAEGALITEAIPSYESGLEVTNYAAAFSSRTYAVSGGEVAITISSRSPVFVEGIETILQTCSELGGNICSADETCSGSWLGASDSEMCCNQECETVIDGYSPFISGFKIQNIQNIPEINEITFQLANELELDYVSVPVVYKYFDEEGNVVWSEGMNYYHIFELSNKYDVSVLPAFYKLGGEWDKDAQRYADFVIDFLDEFQNEHIKYIELQNEPMDDYDSTEGTGRYFAGTPTDLANSTIAVYDEVKKKYPEIIVGSPGFLASSMMNDEYDNLIHNTYFHEYLSAKPKFDIFMLHNYPKSGTYLQKFSSDDKYDFTSEYNIFTTYRTLLDDYGYENMPILATEGQFDMPFMEEDGAIKWDYFDDEEVAILLAERFVLALSNKHNNVIGSMISGIESEFNRALFDYDHYDMSYSTTNKFGFYKKILSYTREYPIHSKHIAGAVNSQDYWIEEFKNKTEQKMWLAFCPVLIDADVHVYPDHSSAIATNKKITYPQNVELNVGNVEEVKIDYGIKSETVKPINGIVKFVLDKTPVFVVETEDGDPEEPTCSELGGNICSTNETCSGDWLDASDNE
ncbi:hypothetical protein KJ673_03695, partial [Patescibacteria group bacterium]|nr:hypothetical protein [Patescibacteria group bacterium]